MGATTARQALREATATAHDAVDRVFGAYTLSDDAGYARFLTAQAAAFLPVEDAIDRSRPGHVLADWPARRRGAALRADLAALGLPVPAVAPLPPFADEAAVLGAIYVLEGSRLGGQLLARGIPADAPRTFLAAGAAGLWRELIQELEKRLVTTAQRATAIAAAQEVFAMFEKAAR